LRDGDRRGQAVNLHRVRLAALVLVALAALPLARAQWRAQAQAHAQSQSQSPPRTQAQPQSQPISQAQAQPQMPPADGAPADPPPALDPAHPILGTWKFVLADGICAETYHFRRDGTTVVTSGAEVSESVFEISAAPSARGFYKLVDRITRHNGKKDCTGETLKVGQQATTFIRIHPSGNLLIFCESESLDACIGPLNRIPDEEM
jgi:hypothetical protein